jgi:hypothetical protein
VYPFFFALRIDASFGAGSEAVVIDLTGNVVTASQSEMAGDGILPSRKTKPDVSLPNHY